MSLTPKKRPTGPEKMHNHADSAGCLQNKRQPGPSPRTLAITDDVACVRAQKSRSAKESCGCQLLCRKKCLICSADPEVASAGLYCPKLQRRFQRTSQQPPLARPAAGVKGPTESPVESMTCTAARL